MSLLDLNCFSVFCPYDGLPMYEPFLFLKLIDDFILFDIICVSEYTKKCLIEKYPIAINKTKVVLNSTFKNPFKNDKIATNTILLDLFTRATSSTADYFTFL
jgi:hypothetical protein